MRLCRWRRRRLADLSSCQLLGGLEIWGVEGRNEAEAGRALSWSPWLSVEQNPSLIKGECRGDTWKWHSPSLRPPSILEMLCMTATATQPAGSPLSPSLSLCLGENINAVVLLADIHTTPTPFNEIQLRTPYGETDDNSRKKMKRRKEGQKDASLLEMRRTRWSLIICKEMKQCVFLMWGWKKEERNQRLQPAVGSWAQELDHLCCGSVDFRPQF